MRHDGTHWGAAKAFRQGLLVTLLSCVGLGACENACVTINSNPGGTITGSTTTCPPSKAMGTVAVNMSAPATPIVQPSAPNVQHVFISLCGVEALAMPLPGEDSTEWQELAPNLATKPVQVDLMAQAADHCASGQFGNAVIPAGVYGQIRLLLAGNQPAESAPVLEENACGRNGFNCLIARDGVAHALEVNDRNEILISPQSIEGGSFRVLPDEQVHLAIAFNTLSSSAVSEDNEFRLLPVFSVSRSLACDTASTPRSAQTPSSSR